MKLISKILLALALLSAPAYAGQVQVTKTFAGLWDIQDVPLGGTTTTYYAVTAATPAATPTDWIIIQGSSTKTVRLKYLLIRGFASSAGSLPIQLVRRSSANSGGTAAAIVGVKADTQDAAATAVVNLYSVNPVSLGTQVGGASAFLGSQRLQLATAGSVNVPVQWSPLQYNLKAYVLRGTSDYIALNMGGAALPSGTTIELEMAIEEE